MIFPYLDGILSPFKSPMVWLLFFLNLVVFSFGYISNEDVRSKIEKMYDDDYFMLAQGRIYSQFIERHPLAYSSLLQKLASPSFHYDKTYLKLLGTLAARDSYFFESAQAEEYEGDQVAVREWQKKFQEYKILRDQHPNHTFGVSTAHPQLTSWFTYQFFHGGFFHLIVNMWFLLVFGGVLEKQMGSAKILGLYLLSGFVGAFFFIKMSGLSMSPLIGASASVSGLMGYFLIENFKKPTRYLYWILPFKEYSGFIYLPSYIALGVWFAADIAGYLSTLPELGGVAHAAHIGGFLFGTVVGMMTVICKSYNFSLVSLK